MLGACVSSGFHQSCQLGPVEGKGRQWKRVGNNAERAKHREQTHNFLSTISAPVPTITPLAVSSTTRM